MLTINKELIMYDNTNFSSYKNEDRLYNVQYNKSYPVVPVHHANFVNDSDNHVTKFPLNYQTQSAKDSETLLPMSNISRIMRLSLPASAKIAKESKTVLQNCVVEFIRFITSEACDISSSEKRKTVTGNDIINTMKNLGFDKYAEILTVFRAHWKKIREQPMIFCTNMIIESNSYSNSQSTILHNELYEEDPFVKDGFTMASSENLLEKSKLQSP